MQKARRITVGLTVGSVGVIAMAFAPVARELAIVWWLVGLAGLGGAALAEERVQPRRRRAERLRSRGAIVVAFVAAMTAGIALVQVADPASAASLFGLT
ncbi:hypothetical protein [Curtobacterium sp. ISL-83]|uniref:hypothetical protein n=1 Tax=Curtobacterium sp. ISL-83 TaxID=2819145 RepID=UPI001BE9CA3E|nr:hypothetical protein [Curtobacterium sp. ISL-83]MBT2502598.1 hypothetical protein [Curtobacterium sp. ISL-83]